MLKQYFCRVCSNLFYSVDVYHCYIINTFCCPECKSYSILKVGLDLKKEGLNKWQ